MKTGLDEKYEKLKEIISTYNSVAVAYSGGIDSTFLLYAACDAFGGRNVTALQGISCLLPTGTVSAADRIFARHFAGKTELRHIKLDPLSWSEFVANDEDRCYVCKKRIYSLFLKKMKKDCRAFLLDGTHADEVQTPRPGMRAIMELHVQTPLLEAGFRKSEIREQAKVLGIVNYDQPSNSCLATRITTNVMIRKEMLKLIDDAEHFLHGMGFFSCRVRTSPEHTVVEVQKKDIEQCAQQINWHIIAQHLREIGLVAPVLDGKGRE
jgi:pyridinium-3,5-biscarboxylic acid mononucleotide sulfurtransferase